MKAIVTGANGFVGSNFIKKLINNGINVLAVDISFQYDKLPSSNLILKKELSIKDIDKLFDFINYGDYDIFYHFARKGSAGKLRENENIQIENALDTANCLRFANKIGCKKFIVAGSIMEFEVNSVIYEQETKPSLSYIYGVGKVLAHEICKPIANQLNISLIWTYITNTYGVGEKSPRFINTTLRKIIYKETLEFTAGTQNYDFVYIDDVCEAFYLIGLYGKKNKGYLIGSGKAKPLKEFIMEMCNSIDPNNKPIFGNVPYTGVNLPLSVYSTDDIYNDCGFVSKISFGEGTKKTFEWLKEADK